MWTTLRSVALLAVAVPATAYVVLDSVVDESTTASRPVVVLAEVGKTQGATPGGGDPRSPAGNTPSTGSPSSGTQNPGTPGATRSGDAASCDDDLDTDDSDDTGTDSDDGVPVVRPCPTEVREDDAGDRDDVEGD